MNNSHNATSGIKSEKDDVNGLLLNDLKASSDVCQGDCHDSLTKKHGNQLIFWQEALQGAPALLELPTDRPRPAVQSYAGAAIEFALDKGLSDGLHALAHRHEATLFMVLQAGWAVLMGRLSGQDDIVVGTPVASRRRSELEGLIGFFVNTLALRTQLDPQQSVAELIEQIKTRTLAAYEHQDVPFEQVVEALRPERNLSHSPLFQTMLVLQNTPGGELALPGLTISTVPLEHENTHFDLTLSLQETAEGLNGMLEYSTALFERATIERWLEHLKVLLGAMVADEQQQLKHLPLLSKEEREQVLRCFNDTQADYPKEALIHELFEQQVQATPDAVAVLYEDKQLSYAQLNARANQLAHHLQNHGVKPGERVVIIVRRGLDSVIGELATLKAGAAYVPIDPAFPAERQAFMIEDSEAVAIIAEGGAANPVSEGGKNSAVWIDLDEQVAHIAACPMQNLAPVQRSAPEVDAYVMYTSGSTGTPKGVLVPHHAVNRLVINNGYAEITPEDAIAHCSNPAFDASTFEIWGALLNGARVVIVPHEQVMDPLKFREILLEQKVSILWLTAGLFNQYADALGDVFVRLKYLLAGGDVLDPVTVRKVLKNTPPQNLLNGYGPTETTTFATTCCLNGVVDEQTRTIPIGKPIANARIYILDEAGQPVPIGVAGEIHIAGDGVARGYLNRPELTEEKFIPDPFSDRAGARMYKTGDLGRWRADGAIEYLGRNDFQVKIRGLRIELGEIEARLTELPQVHEAVVLAREEQPGDKRLVAYWTPQTDVMPPAASQADTEEGVQAVSRVQEIEALRTYLQEHLPGYMVPSAFVKLDVMPLTPNGKVDRKVLPAPEGDAYAAQDYEPPQGETEQMLATIWQELLGVERVGRHDNFFDLGGHSLLLVALAEQIQQRHFQIGIQEILETRDLAALAASLQVRREEDAWQVPPNRIPVGSGKITPEMLPLVDLSQDEIDLIVATVPGGAANIQDIYPLAPLQEGMVLHHRLDTDGDPYVLKALVSFDSRDVFDRFIVAVNALIERHDVLRTAIVWEGLPRAVQVVYRHAELNVVPFKAKDHDDVLVELRDHLEHDPQIIGLGQAPLLSVRIVQQERDEKCYALLLMHHVITDHVALDLLFEELNEVLSGRGQSLPEPSDYRTFVAHSLARSDTAAAKAWFHAMLGDVHEPTLPFGLLNVHGDGSGLEEVRLKLDDKPARKTRAVARSLGMSPAVLFHVAYALMLAHCCNRHDVVFGSMLSGRMGGIGGLDRMQGLCINALPVRVRLHGVSVLQVMKTVQTTLNALLRYEQTPLAEAQLCSGVEPGLPLFSALLNYAHSKPLDVLLPFDGVELNFAQERTNYPFNMSVEDSGEGFLLIAQTEASVVSARRVADYMQRAVEQVVHALEHAPQTEVLKLSILPEAEREQILKLFNDTQADYPREALIHELFEQQVQATPDAVAVVYEDEQLSYAQLNTKANQLAHRLRTLGVVPDTRVAICVERSLEMVVGL
ncbi:MAG: amino acid adenylation domain-containing protein, partial [Lautropia sp.]|nr:amino acid adenylation domain-containing protein [Lautropia sp.]